MGDTYAKQTELECRFIERRIEGRKKRDRGERERDGGRRQGEREPKTWLPLQKNSTKRAGSLHLCTVRVLLAMCRGVTHCDSFLRGRAKVCLNTNIPPFLFIEKVMSYT